MGTDTARAKGSRKMHAGKKALFTLVTTCALLGLLEAGLRLMSFEYGTSPRYLSFHQDKYLFSENEAVFERDDALFWRFIPGTTALGINAQGFRGPDFQVAKTPESKRILCLGDSVTFGVEEPLSYASILESELNRAWDPKHVQVFNLGVPGYSSLQGVRLIESALKRYRPDLVTFMFGWNDHWLCRHLPDKEQKPPAQAIEIAGRLRIYQFLQYLLGTFSIGSPAQETGPDAFRVSIEDYGANLRKAASMARRYGCEILFITAPTAISHRNKIPGYLVQDRLIAETTDLPVLHARYNEVVRVTAAELGVPLADCARTLNPWADQWMMRDGIHPNKEGHHEIARVLFDTIQTIFPAP